MQHSTLCASTVRVSRIVSSPPVSMAKCLKAGVFGFGDHTHPAAELFDNAVMRDVSSIMALRVAMLGVLEGEVNEVRPRSNLTGRG